MLLIDIVGWLGMALLLTAFALASSKRISDTRSFYHLLNLLGAAAVFVNALTQRVWAVAAVEAVWVCIAVTGLVKIQARRAHALE